LPHSTEVRWTPRDLRRKITTVTSPEYPTGLIRLSDADREHAIEVLRENVVNGRLSQDTFARRMELALLARGRGELDALVADLPRDGALTRWTTRLIGAVSGFNAAMRKAWWAERMPNLMLPEPGPFPLRIGRDPGCGLRLSDDSVSRAHAELRRADGSWLLRDLGSMNGTWINGRRVIGEAPVHPGDVVLFGRVGFRLADR
jgi:hypothetical protein